MNLVSSKGLSLWRCDLTLFQGYYDTLPADEIRDAPWLMLLATVAPPGGPAPVEIKENGYYFVPCMLREATYIGKTGEKAIALGWPSLIGKQRSASHVTESALLTYDLDGMTTNQWAAIKARLEGSGLAFLAYSTWSYGLKPGVRVRVLIPMDSRLPKADYERAWIGAAAVLFAEVVARGKILDPSGAKIHQQQGIWAATREREHLAFRVEGKGGVASADAVSLAINSWNAKVEKSVGSCRCRSRGAE